MTDLLPAGNPLSEGHLADPTLSRSLCAIPRQSAKPKLEDHGWLHGATRMLVCVKGDDIGAVLPLIGSSFSLTFGRTLPQVTDSRVSREHLEIRWDQHQVQIRERSSLNGSKILRSNLGTSSALAHTWRVLKDGNTVAVGGSHWQLRTRPRSVKLPSAERRTIPATRQRLFGQWHVPRISWRMGIASILMALSLTRLLFFLPSLALYALGGGLGVLSAIWLIARLFANKPDAWDGGLLAIHLEHCASQPQRSDTAHLGNTRSERCAFPWHEAAQCNLWDDSKLDGDLPCQPGFFGAHAYLQALWTIATNARPYGGARVIDEKGTITCGNAARTVHICRDAVCLLCTSTSETPIAHVYIAELEADLPPQCDVLFPSDHTPVSISWARQVFRTEPENSTPSLSDQIVYASALWSARTPPTNQELSCLLGQTLQGSPAQVDLVNDGPHAVIVGITGSGKSEALITLLLGLAQNYSPQELRFVLIDYKGGASLSPLSTLPHTETLLTDHQQHTSLRTFEGIRCLVDHRSALLAKSGFSSLSQWKQQSPETAPPRIVIACDEFTTFADLHPELFDDIIRWTAQGRALGIHIVLATQRPDRALSSAILANVDLRIALRCREAHASRTLVGSDLAAQLPAIPGRAVSEKHGVFQCAWVDNISATVTHINKQWETSSEALWLPPLPASYDNTQRHVPHHPKSPVFIGLCDGIRHGTHRDLAWTSGHIRLEGTPHDQDFFHQACTGIGTTIAQATHQPLIVLSDTQAELPDTALQISESTPDCLNVLANLDTRSVVVIPNRDSLYSHLEDMLGPIHANALWNEFQQRAHEREITIVCATTTPTTQWDKEARLYSYRFLSAHSQTFLTQWGLHDTKLSTPEYGRVIVVHAPARTTTPDGPAIDLPALAVIARYPMQSEEHPQHVSQLDQHSRPPNHNTLIPLLRTWKDTDTDGEKIDLLITHAAPDTPPAGLLAPLRWTIRSQTQVLSPQQWHALPPQTQLTIVICDLTEELRRALLMRAYDSDWLLRLRHLPSDAVLILKQGTVTYFTLTHKPQKSQ